MQIYYIFGITNYTAEEICQLYNNCPQDRPGPGPGRSSRVRPQASELRPPSQAPAFTRAATNEERAARRANAIKLLHLTDIHVDDEYLEVSLAFLSINHLFIHIHSVCHIWISN